MQRLKGPDLVILVLAAVLLVGSVLGFARDRDSSSGTTQDVADGGPFAVEILDFAFGPDQVTVVAGDTVTWSNSDSATHTITGQGNEVIDSPDLGESDTFEVTFDDAGSYEYFCKFHPFMVGTVTVQG